MIWSATGRSKYVALETRAAKPRWWRTPPVFAPYVVQSVDIVVLADLPTSDDFGSIPIPLMLSRIDASLIAAGFVGQVMADEFDACPSRGVALFERVIAR